MPDLAKQKEALVNNITAAIDVMIRDSIELHYASKRTEDQEVLEELRERVRGGKELLQKSLEQLLL